MNTKKIHQKIRVLLQELTVIPEAVSARIEHDLSRLPEQGLAELYTALIALKKRQDALLTQAITADKNFLQSLDAFLRKEYREATAKITEKEHEDADMLLQNLDDL